MKILRGIILLPLVFLSAGCVTKEETDEIKSQLASCKDSLSNETQRINELEFKVEAISSDLQSLKPPVPVEMPKMTIEEIKKVQLALATAGFDAGKADGKMGPQTIQAIKKFQETNSIKADGIVGKETWEKLQGYINAIK